MQGYDQEYYSTLSQEFGSLLSLDEYGVVRFFQQLGYNHYQPQLLEHGITGEVLVHLDHQSLKDVGVHSVGQRLNILKTVFVLKVLNNVPIEEGNYVPPSEELEDGQIPSSQIINLLTERDDRIRTLEHEVHHLHSALQNLRDEALSIARTAAASSGKPRPSLRSPTSSGFPHPLSNASTLSRSNSLSNPSTTPIHPRPRAVPSNPNLSVSAQLHPSTAQSIHNLPDSPNSPGIDSPRMVEYQHTLQQQQQQSSQNPSSSSHLGVEDISINGITTPTTPTAPLLVHPGQQHQRGDQFDNSNALNLSTASSTSSRPSTSTTTTTTNDTLSTAPTATSSTSTSRPSRERDPSTTTNLGGGTNGTDSNNPYRSFRVTLEDPCYKVLPAALKKYKINDDWRLYALFICYGNTERCLAYDEKPLLLFQRLKESNDNPVFMLRHIKDIKSPISVASAKHAQRRDKRPSGIGSGVERSLMGVNRDGSIAASTTTTTTTTNGTNGGGANGLQPNARPTRLHHPPVLLPVGKERGEKNEEEDGGVSNGDRNNGGEGGGDKGGGKKSMGYCIAIYPYLAEREDEFDVAVGDTFIILSKTKGWWVVHRDSPPPSSNLSSSTSSNPDNPPQARKSAWVPAGCLLETSVPPLSLLPNDLHSSSNSNSSRGAPHSDSNAASVPILPSYVVSVSTPGIALMDYSPRGTGELEVRKNQPLRILKRYNHWSYAIKEDGGRGWVPSWFCGRASKGDGTPTTPTTATAPSTTSNDPTRPATAPSTQPLTSSLLTPLSTTASSSSTNKPSISIALPSPGGAVGLGGGAKSAGAVMTGGGTMSDYVAGATTTTGSSGGLGLEDGPSGRDD